ncbi:MAG: amidohydrolase family protein, partial [Natronospirillum sp.]
MTEASLHTQPSTQSSTPSPYPLSPMAEVFRGPLLHFLDDPGNDPEPRPGSYEWFADGVMVVDRGKVVTTGDAATVLRQLPADLTLTHWPDALIVPGFIDSHVHMPQLGVIASYGAQLLDWLNDYTFPMEAQFADVSWAETQAERFVDLLLSHGTTSGLVFCTTHPTSVDATFQAAAQRGMALAAGKCLMDRNAPDNLMDTAQGGV